MEDLGFYFIFYGYVLPLMIMMLWIIWKTYSELKSGRKYVSTSLKNYLPLLIPSVSLFSAGVIVLVAIDKFFEWVLKIEKQ